MALIEYVNDDIACEIVSYRLADEITEDLARLVYSGAWKMVRVKTGATRRGISLTRKPTQRYRVGWTVNATHKISMIEHQGAKRHKIRPRRKGGMLVFYWDKVGHVVHLPQVNHPGRTGSKFLSTPLLMEGARMNFKTSILMGGSMVNINV